MRYFDRDGLTFDLDDSHDGESSPPRDVVVLLHGWPQDRRAWRSVTPHLVEGGLRVLAPDLRGYSPGARPPDPAAYEITESVADVIALADAAGAQRVHVVGHDWGGALAWVVASRHPERVASLTVLSTPHPAAMAWAFKNGDQARRSAYMVFFALPVLPAAIFKRATRRFLVRSGLPSDLAAMYGQRMGRPGAARASLNWYRASLPLRQMLQERLGRGRSQAPNGSAERAKDASAIVPTTYVWGSKDAALGRDAAERTGVVMRRAAERAGLDPDAVYRFVELEVGHWLPEKRPAEVADAILDRVRSV